MSIGIGLGMGCVAFAGAVGLSVAITSPAAGSSTRGATFAISWTVNDPAASVIVMRNATVLGTAVGSGSASYVPDATWDGAGTFSVLASRGTISGSASISYTINPATHPHVTHAAQCLFYIDAKDANGGTGALTDVITSLNDRVSGNPITLVGSPVIGDMHDVSNPPPAGTAYNTRRTIRFTAAGAKYLRFDALASTMNGTDKDIQIVAYYAHRASGGISAVAAFGNTGENVSRWISSAGSAGGAQFQIAVAGSFQQIDANFQSTQAPHVYAVDDAGATRVCTLYQDYEVAPAQLTHASVTRTCNTFTIGAWVNSGSFIQQADWDLVALGVYRGLTATQLREVAAAMVEDMTDQVVFYADGVTYNMLAMGIAQSNGVGEAQGALAGTPEPRIATRIRNVFNASFPTLWINQPVALDSLRTFADPGATDVFHGAWAELALAIRALGLRVSVNVSGQVATKIAAWARSNAVAALFPIAGQQNMMCEALRNFWAHWIRVGGAPSVIGLIDQWESDCNTTDQPNYQAAFTTQLARWALNTGGSNTHVLVALANPNASSGMDPAVVPAMKTSQNNVIALDATHRHAISQDTIGTGGSNGTLIGNVHRDSTANQAFAQLCLNLIQANSLLI